MKGNYIYKKLQPHPIVLILYTILFLMGLSTVILLSWHGHLQGYDISFISAIAFFSIVCIGIVFLALETIALVKIDSDTITVSCYRGTVAIIRLCDIHKVIYKYGSKGIIGLIIEYSETGRKIYKRSICTVDNWRIILHTEYDSEKDKLVKLFKKILSSDVIWAKETYCGL